MTVLVTGASGLIGSHLCKALAEERCDVVALYRTASLLFRDITTAHFLRITPEICNITDSEHLTALLKKYNPEVVVHLAASCLPYHKEQNFVNVNIRGTVNLVNATEATDARQLIYASSMSVYSTPPLYLPVNERHPTQPTGAYGQSKLIGEHICQAIITAARITVIRFAGVFGVGDDARVAGLFMKAALSGEPLIVQGDGSQSSDFIYVDDAVQGIMKVVQRKATGIYNIGSGRETTIRELAEQTVKVTESTSRIERQGETNRPFRFVSDITKARNDLDYAPTGLVAGLRKYAERMREDHD